MNWHRTTVVGAGDVSGLAVPAGDVAVGWPADVRGPARRVVPAPARGAARLSGSSGRPAGRCNRPAAGPPAPSRPGPTGVPPRPLARRRALASRRLLVRRRHAQACGLVSTTVQASGDRTSRVGSATTVVRPLSDCCPTAGRYSGRGIDGPHGPSTASGVRVVVTQRRNTSQRAVITAVARRYRRIRLRPGPARRAPGRRLVRRAGHRLPRAAGAGRRPVDLDVVRNETGEVLYRQCEQPRHHHHLVCRACGLTQEVAAPGVEKWARVGRRAVRLRRPRPPGRTVRPLRRLRRQAALSRPAGAARCRSPAAASDTELVRLRGAPDQDPDVGR